MGEAVGIILQARMGSSRLPGKVLKPFFHTTLLGWILERLSGLPWPVVTATGQGDCDDLIERACLDSGRLCFRGEEDDVLDRFYRCGKTYGFSHVVRLTADNPFPDTVIVRSLVEMHASEAAAYSHAFGDLPIGVGAEIFSLEALERSWHDGQRPNHREHVNEYILEHPQMFKVARLEIPVEFRCPNLALTIDTPADYERITGYFDSPPDMNIGTKALIEQCSSSA
jgi:spore coat polysaccharide biosynthesis protein SpsF